MKLSSPWLLSLLRLSFVAAALVAVSGPASAEAPSTAEQVKTFFPKTKGPQLPPYTGGVTFGMSEEESAKVLPEPFLKGPMRHTPEAFPALQVGADRSSGGFYELRVHVEDVDMMKLLRRQWGKPKTQQGIMTTKYIWTNPKKGVRAILEGSFGQKNIWTLVLRQYAEDATLFKKGRMDLPVSLGKATLGQTESEFKALLPALTDDNWFEPPGHGGLRIWYFTWSDEESDRIEAFAVTFKRDPTKMLRKLWGKPKKDSEGHTYWINKKIMAGDKDGKQSKGIRATVVKRSGSYSLSYTANSRGDYIAE